MSVERDTTRIVRSWLRADEHESADRVLDAVLDRLDATPQRSPSWLARRTPIMNKFVGFGLAAAAVVVVALIGYQLLAGTPAPGGAPASPSEALSEAPSEAPSPGGVRTLEAEMGALFAGTYLITDVEPFTLTITIPEGWESLGIPAQVWGAGNPKSAVAWYTIDDLYADPCDPTQGALDVGPTVDDLVQALTTYPGLTVDQATDVMHSGYAGIRVELTGVIDCGGSEAVFLRSQPGSVDRPYPGTADPLLILDVAGDRLVISGSVGGGAPADMAEVVQSIIDSTVIEAP